MFFFKYLTQKSPYLAERHLLLVKRRIFKVFQNASLITQNFLHFLIIHHIHYIAFHVENTYSLGDCHVKIFSKTHVYRNEMRQKNSITCMKI